MTDKAETGPEPQTARLTLRMSPNVKARIVRLMDRMDALDEGEVIRRALAVYDELTVLADHHHDIIARDDEGKETVLRFL